MKIGILGAGQVGSRLGKAWATHGHEIMFSSRTPTSDRMQALVASAGANAQAGSVQETIDFGEIVVIALHWDALDAVLRSTSGWKNKLVIDVSNRFIPPPVDTVGSAAQDIAKITGANVVKTLNHIGAENMVEPDFNGIPATMFMCGDDAEAKNTVKKLVEQLGAEVIDIGWLREAHHLESLAKFWVHLWRNDIAGRNMGFKLLKK